MRRPSPAGGFTLIEVLVALAIVSISLLSVAAAMNQMIDAANSLRDRTYADWIAQNKIVEIRLSGVEPEAGSSSGEIEYASVDWSWRSVISETGVEDLYRVDVSVSLAGTDYDLRTVTGFVGPPTIPGQSNRAWTGGGAGRGPGVPGQPSPDDGARE
ncbi:MAG: type II secretion system minor pseudopilin GspI [Woeseiaceae bacterium]|nr:type II secretion system minor pseudopilin GspI [Woeseiaceae bacterium]